MPHILATRSSRQAMLVMTDVVPLAMKAARDGVTHLIAGVAAFGLKGRPLLLRQAPGRDVPGSWELPSTALDGDELPVHAARRGLQERTGLSLVNLDGYVGHLDHGTARGLARQLISSRPSTQVPTAPVSRSR